MSPRPIHCNLQKFSTTEKGHVAEHFGTKIVKFLHITCYHFNTIIQWKNYIFLLYTMNRRIQSLFFITYFNSTKMKWIKQNFELTALTSEARIVSLLCDTNDATVAPPSRLSTIEDALTRLVTIKYSNYTKIQR